MNKRLLFMVFLQLGTLQAVYSTKQVRNDSYLSIQSLPADLKRVSDSFYVGKVADDFYLAMERISKKNICAWRYYARKQFLQATDLVKIGCKYLRSSGGIKSFCMVLKNYYDKVIFDCNELWVAYATSTPPVIGSPNSSIDMFMTVITSPKACLTTHKGISRSADTATAFCEPGYGGKKRYQKMSVVLHSFAGAVSKIIYPEKLYMMTNPLRAMRNILIQNMPKGSVSVGDNVYAQKLKSLLENMPTAQAVLRSLWCQMTRITDYELHSTNIMTSKDLKLLSERKKKVGDSIVKLQRAIVSQMQLKSILLSNPPRIKIDKNGAMTIMDSIEKKAVLRIDDCLSAKAYQWLKCDIYKPNTLLPYVLCDLSTLAGNFDNVRKITSNSGKK